MHLYSHVTHPNHTQAMAGRAPRKLDLEAIVPEKPEEGQEVTKYTDPCKRAALQSMRCLERNNHDKSMCQDEFII